MRQATPVARRRAGVAGLVYHVLDRRVGRGKLFAKPGDYAAFEAVHAGRR